MGTPVGHVGCYFPCSKEFTAANEVLAAYRRYYPTNTVVMVNDTGDEKHSLLGQRYKCKYFYETENTGYPDEHQQYDQIICWVKRFLHYISFIEDEWFFLLGDDVLIRKAVDEKTLQSDINGINPPNKLPWPSVNIIKERGYHNDKKELIYGASKGAIFLTSFFKNMAARIDEVERDLNLFGVTWKQSLTGQDWYSSDVVLSFLTYLYGGTVGLYSESAEFHSKDLNTRFAQNRVNYLTQYDCLHKYPPHPQLCTLDPNKYTIVLPTRGKGDTFDIFIEQLLPRYLHYLKLEDVAEFIIICPEAFFTSAQERILAASKDHAQLFTFYTDESIITTVGDNWMRQQIITMAICSRIKTDYYMIILDDLVLTKPLALADFFDEKKRILYSFEECWPTNGPYFSTNTAWWLSSLVMTGIHQNVLTSAHNLMGTTPQLFITRIVHQLIHSLGPHWDIRMVSMRAIDSCLYWIYLMKTIRTQYYTPSRKFFAMDNEVNILKLHLTREEVIKSLKKGITEKTYFFLVAQSWLKYPKEWYITGLTE